MSYSSSKSTKYKVGDKVIVKSIEWYKSKNPDNLGYVSSLNVTFGFNREMARLCGKIITIKECHRTYAKGLEVNKYYISESQWTWSDDMIAGYACDVQLEIF